MSTEDEQRLAEARRRLLALALYEEFLERRKTGDEAEAFAAVLAGPLKLIEEKGQ